MRLRMVFRDAEYDAEGPEPDVRATADRWFRFVRGEYGEDVPEPAKVDPVVDGLRQRAAFLAVEDEAQPIPQATASPAPDTKPAVVRYASGSYEKSDDRILAGLKAFGPIPVSGLARAIDMSVWTLHYHLRRLGASGRAVITGRGRATRWTIATTTVPGQGIETAPPSAPKASQSRQPWSDAPLVGPPRTIVADGQEFDVVFSGRDSLSSNQLGSSLGGAK